MLHARLAGFTPGVKSSASPSGEFSNTDGPVQGQTPYIFESTVQLVENDEWRILGNHTLKILAFDKAGNKATKEISVTVE
jgi:hypothetical protein